MEDIIALRVRLDSGEDRYFLTWGCVFDQIDPRQTEEVVLASAEHCSLGGKPVSAELCFSLQDASSQEYFYEALFTMACTGGPQFGANYDEWAAKCRQRMEDGKDIWYLGTPRS